METKKKQETLNNEKYLFWKEGYKKASVSMAYKHFLYLTEAFPMDKTINIYFLFTHVKFTNLFSFSSFPPSL